MKRTYSTQTLTVALVAVLFSATALCADPLAIPDVSKDETICFALYTVHDGILKLTAQLYPLEKGDDRTVRLEVQDDDQWRQIAKTQVVMPGWTAPFRVEGWDSSKNVAYRVAHGDSAFYTGTIRRDPVTRT